ncbi:MAG: hypothetical protein K0S25_333 [Bacillus sp. (in: firmicutes)]|jgi:flagellar M-ring protein FliF|nr:hypothetical protein [Bacillus sp. (in: firmicutes)]
MNQRLRELKEKYLEYWNSVSNKRKLLFIGVFIAVIAALSLSIYFVSKPSYVPLYANEMSQKEIGDIKAELDREGYTGYRLENNGTTISVPQQDASNLLVSLAAKGLPKTGTISFFDMTKDLQFGATDRQLDAMEREALQGEVSDLLKHVEGVKNAAVVISTPEDSLFVRPDDNQKASASVVIELEPGYELEPKQIQVLYHLVSKSIPNLPKENIVMTDQGGQGLDNPQQSTAVLNSYDQQRKIQKDIEADIQKNLQQMLGTIMGHNKVLIQTFVRLNFDQVKKKESLVEPVNKEKNEGIAVSLEEINKTYSGKDASSGVSGTGQTDIPGYASTDSSPENKSEELEKRINYEVNRITNEIVQSPYKIEDLTINVGVEPPDPKNPSSLTAGTKKSIQQILANVVRTALSDNSNLTEDEVTSRITVFSREFSGKAELANTDQQTSLFPTWGIYAIIGAVAVLLIVMLFMLFRRRKLAKEEDLNPFPVFEERKEEKVQELEEEKVVIKRQIEEMAKDQPEEFVGLLRNWLSRD